MMGSMSARTPRLQHHCLAPGYQPLFDSTETLGADDVCVWLAEPAAWREPANRERLLALLSEEERVRQRRFHFDEDRLAFLVAHGLVRMALSRYAPVAPTELTQRIASRFQEVVSATRQALEDPAYLQGIVTRMWGFRRLRRRVPWPDPCTSVALENSAAGLR